MRPVALTIAGSDPSGGAGIQADLKTFHQFGVYGEAVVTLLTVQNTVCVSRVECLAPELIIDQLTAVVDDIPPRAAKTGALGDAAVVEAVAEAAANFEFPLVVDPVMISKHGAPLLSDEACELVAARLLQQAALVTPNLPEAEALSGMRVGTLAEMKDAASKILDLGAEAVLIKGGHSKGEAVDLLHDGDDWHEYVSPRIHTPHTHGTGCTLSAAITAELARGAQLPEAVGRAKDFITKAIETNPGLGRGSGPVNHHARVGEAA